VHLIYNYVEEMLRAGSVLDPPDRLAARRFERYLGPATLECADLAEIRSEL